MKPIFEEERIFFKEKTGVDLPKDCWRDGSTIYLNADIDTKIIRFKVKGRDIEITKDLRDKVLKKYPNKSLLMEIEENNSRLNSLEKESIDMTRECLLTHKSHHKRISYSGGKDSDVMLHIVKKTIESIEENIYFDIDFFNTSNDTGDTYKHIKNTIKNSVVFLYQKENLTSPSNKELEKLLIVHNNKWIHNPDKGIHRWIIEDKNYYIPTSAVRNCCSTYKEGKIKNLLSEKEEYVLFLGMRKDESNKRKEYDWYLNDKINELWKQTRLNKYRANMLRNWVRFLPIVNWTDKDIWLYMLREDIEFNPMYKKGFGRVGCLMCPYMSDYSDLLAEYNYKLLWNNWCSIVDKNYDIYGVERTLKWTREEYVYEGKWKNGADKLHDIILNKPTPERVKQVSGILGVSETIASRYFQKKCSCGKSLTALEVAMYLKLYGRFNECESDNRQYKCKKCVSADANITQKEYTTMARDFREQGCSLF